MSGGTAYAGYEDMQQRFGSLELLQLTDIDPDAPISEPDRGMVDKALGDASELVNGYAAGRYALPLSPVPDPVARWTCDIARYYLHRDAAPERIRKAYEDAVAALKDVAKGAILLQSEGVTAPATVATGGAAQSSGPPRIFSQGGLRGY